MSFVKKPHDNVNAIMFFSYSKDKGCPDNYCYGFEGSFAGGGDDSHIYYNKGKTNEDACCTLHSKALTLTVTETTPWPNYLTLLALSFLINQVCVDDCEQLLIFYVLTLYLHEF